MREFLILLVHLVVVVVRLARPAGLRGVVAESVLVRHQMLILNRGRKRAPNLRVADRFIAGVCTLFICRARLLRSAIVSEAVHAIASPPRADQAKVSAAVFAYAPASSRPQGPGQRTHRCRGGDETPESSLGLSSHRSADRSGFRD